MEDSLPNRIVSMDENVNGNDEDQPVLSSEALAALKEFLSEQNQSLTDPSEKHQGGGDSSEVALVSEDWRLSQFWYDPLTAETVANEVLTLCNNFESPRIACVACPTLYAYLKKINPNVSVQLLEFDNRFDQYGNDFTFYDYNQPEELPLELKHAFPIVIADPPYLSKECLEKITETISFLTQSQKYYLLLLTGEVQRDIAAELMGLHPCRFRPQHSSKLGNEFRLFTNYDPGMRLEGWERKDLQGYISSKTYIANTCFRRAWIVWRQIAWHPYSPMQSEPSDAFS